MTQTQPQTTKLATFSFEPDARDSFRQIMDEAKQDNPGNAQETTFEITYTRASGKNQKLSGKGRRARKFQQKQKKKQQTRKNVKSTTTRTVKSTTHASTLKSMTTRGSTLPADFVLNAANLAVPAGGPFTLLSDSGSEAAISEYSVAISDMSLDSHCCEQIEEGVSTSLDLLEQLRAQLEHQIRTPNSLTREKYERVMSELTALRIHYEKLRKAYNKALNKLDTQRQLHYEMADKISELSITIEEHELDIQNKAKTLEDYETTQRVNKDEIHGLRVMKTEHESKLKTFEESLKRMEEELTAKAALTVEQASTIQTQSGVIGKLEGELTAAKREVEKLDSKSAQAEQCKASAISDLETERALWFERQKALEVAVKEAKSQHEGEKQSLMDENLRLCAETSSNAASIRELTAQKSAEKAHALAASDDNKNLKLDLETLTHEKTALLATSAEAQRTAEKAVKSSEAKTEEVRAKNTELGAEKAKLEHALDVTKAELEKITIDITVTRQDVVGLGQENGRLTESIKNANEKLDETTAKYQAVEEKYRNEKKTHKTTAEMRRAAEQDCKLKDQAIVKWEEWMEETKIEIVSLRKSLDSLKERNRELGNRNDKLDNENLAHVATITKKNTEIKNLKTSLKAEEEESNQYLDRVHALERQMRMTKTSMGADVRKLEKSHAKAKEITKLQSRPAERSYKERHHEEDQREINRLQRMVIDLQGNVSMSNLTVPMADPTASPSPIPLSSYENSPERTPEMGSQGEREGDFADDLAMVSVSKMTTRRTSRRVVMQ